MLPISTTEDLDRIYSVNVKGVFNCIKVGIESMKAKGGSIINISSIVAHVVFPDIELCDLFNREKTKTT